MIDSKNVFNQPVKNELLIYENIQKIATGQGDDYVTDCLLDYNHFKDDSNRCQQIASSWCWSRSNTTN